jgi:hypothetical protein
LILKVLGIILPLFLFFFVVSSPNCFSATKGDLAANEMLAIGVGTIEDGNIALAKRNAVAHALEKGAENYLINRLGSKTIARNFDRFLREIVPKAVEGVENFYILSEQQSADMYRVLVKMKINERLLDQELSAAGLHSHDATPVKVLFLVAEIREKYPAYWWMDPEAHTTLNPTDLILHRVFQESGLNPVNRTLNLPESDFPESMRAPSLFNEDALRWGRLYTADVVVVGKAVVDDTGRILLTLKALDVDRRIEICSETETGRIAGNPDDEDQFISSLDETVSRIADRLAPCVARNTASKEMKTTKLLIEVIGLRSFREIRALRDFLKTEVAGVKLVRQTRVKKHSTSMTVEFEGNPETFLERTLRHENLPFPMETVETQEGRIVFSVP